MQRNQSFTEGPIVSRLVRFALPVLGALILQAMYGAVDLMVVGRFAEKADVSAVSTGSQLMMGLTGIITGLSMGSTVLLGQTLGRGSVEGGDPDAPGRVVGGAVCLFGMAALLMSAVVTALAGPLSRLLNAPQEAFSQTVGYVTVCALGMLFIAGYNVLAGLFRGMGDSRTPLMAVVIACVCNITGDLILVKGLRMGSVGAALATVLSQGLSVLICLPIIHRRGLPFAFSRKHVGFHRDVIRETVRLGAPIALQDLLVSVSFLGIVSIVNSLGVVVSAGVGVAEKLCSFVLLIPSAFMQSLSAFVAQNTGAGRDDRSRRAMLAGMLISFSMGLVIGTFAFFRGDLLAGLFAKDPDVVAAGAEYLKAYAIDTLLVSFFFCFNGYFNGLGETRFVMAQGLVSAFLVRLPFSWLMSRLRPVSLFRIGLAIPLSSLCQIAMCLFWYWRIHGEARDGRTRALR